MKRIALALLFSAFGARLACAGDELPQWPTVEESWGSWFEIGFEDAQGKGHTVWCHYAECGSQNKTGTANLYVFTRAGEQSFTTSEGSLWWKKTWTAYKTTFSTKLSDYKLKLNGRYGVVTLPGTGFEREMTRGNYMDQLTATGSVMIVMAPIETADDAPKAVAETPAPKKTETPAPIAKKPQPEDETQAEEPKEEPKPEPKKEEPKTQPTQTTPAGQDPLSLSEDEQKLLSTEDQKAYFDEVGDAKEDLDKRKQIVAKYRQIISMTNLDPDTLAKLSPENASKYQQELAGATSRDAREKIVKNYREVAAMDQAAKAKDNPGGIMDGNTRKTGTTDKGAVRGNNRDGNETDEQIAKKEEANRLEREKEEAAKNKQPNLVDKVLGKDSTGKGKEEKKDDNPWRDNIAGLKVAIVAGVAGLIMGGPLVGLLFGLLGFMAGNIISSYSNR